MKFSFYVLIPVLFLSSSVFSQKGKHGALTVTATSRINEFTTLATNAAAGNTTITVAASLLNTNGRFAGNLAAGDLLMIIQMQGALMKLSPVPVWAPDSTYGNVYNYGSCGNYEFAEVKSVVSSTQIELTCGLTYNYSSAGRTQIVRVPRYTSLTVTGTGTLTTDAWTGSIGGILSAEVDGNTTILAGGAILATGLGFRGGVAVGNAGSGNGNFATKNPDDGAEKGEGIGSDRLINSAGTNDTLGKQCKGAPANGGGGGNANNCGGGGGGNAGNLSMYYGTGVPNAAYATAFNLEYPGRASVISSGGGKGGYGTSTVNGNPNLNKPDISYWGGFLRPSRGGFGGRPLDYSTGRIYMGGGGGAGHRSASQSNGANASTGGAGGGIIYLLNYGTISGAGAITSNGANGFNAFGNTSVFNTIQGIDGAGGAGAGGTIILNSNGAISGITANVNGGTGGNQVITGFGGATTNEGQGPGGGGGGGYIAANASIFTQNVNGGANGVTNAVAFATAFPMNGATSGNSGLSGQVIPSYTLNVASVSQTICANQSATVSATTTNPGSTVQWYTAATGGNAVATGTLYTTPVYVTPGTYTVFAGSCPGLYRIPVTITVNSGLAISVNSPTICPGQTAILTATSTATSYTWNTGATTNPLSVNPGVTTIYTVTGSNGSCAGSQTATVSVGSGIGVTVNSATICAGTSTLLTAGGATTYTWSTGATTSTISVNPSSTTLYTVTGAAGTCTGSASSTVSVNALPIVTVGASPATICSGGTSTLTANGAATYTWSNGFNGSSQPVSPATNTTYTVSGTNAAGCTGTVTASVTLTVTPNPTVAVNSPTICSGQSATLSASGATSYSWTTGETTSTMSVSPGSTSTYTVTGTNGSCSSMQTATITVSPALGIAVNSPTICAGQAALLTATSSATSYTWSTGANTNTVSVSPVSTTVYTVAGSAGTCAGLNTATVTVNPSPALTVTASSANICTGQTTTLSVSGATSYTWSNGANTATQNLNPAGTTIYSVSGTAAGGCVSPVPATITINVTPTPTVNVSSVSVCTGASATLTASGATSYTWNTGETGATITPSPFGNTSYTVSGSNGGCSTSAVATVSVVGSQPLTVSTSSPGGCVPLCASFLNSGVASSTISYNFGDGNTSASHNPTHCYTASGSYTVTSTATDLATGCVSSYTLPNPLIAFPEPLAAFSVSDGTTVIAGSTVSFINSSSGATSYSWTTCNPGSFLTTDLSLSGLDTGVCCITLTAVNSGGCTDAVTQCIAVINEATVSVPNVFTPNNDSQNDVFKITAAGIKDLTCGIYDRWGLKMYEWNGVNGSWDGNSKGGVPAVDGSYFYIINYTDFKGTSKTEKGFLSLFRN